MGSDWFVYGLIRVVAIEVTMKENAGSTYYVLFYEFLLVLVLIIH
jgi:hypothetical protein